MARRRQEIEAFVRHLVVEVEAGDTTLQNGRNRSLIMAIRLGDLG